MMINKTATIPTYVGLRSIIFSLTLSCLLIVYYQHWKSQRWCDQMFTASYRTPLTQPTIIELNAKPLKINKHFKQPKISQNTQRKHTNLMIISQGRSGSSFVGQIFNHHPDVFYIYEPLHTLERVDSLDSFIGNTTSEYNHRASMILREIFSCSFKKSLYLDYLSRLGHFRFSSRVLRSPPFCMKSQTENKTMNEVFEKQWCSYLKPEILNPVCKTYRVTVIKVLEHRIIGRTLKSLQPLLEVKGFENKILYLVRDPRAVISSMYQAGWIATIGQHGRLIPFQPFTKRFRWYVKRICLQMETNINFLKNPPNWSKGRVFFLRYEDLITQAENITRDMLRFIGLEVQPGLNQWIYQHMHAQNATLGGTDGIYATKKNSSLIMNKWRLEASLEMVQVIEQHCKTVMDFLGYILINGSEALQYRIGHFSLTKSLPNYRWTRRT